MKNKNYFSYSQFLFFLLTVLIFVSCSNQTRDHGADAGRPKDKKILLKKPPSTFSDTLTIDLSAAVFYYPDSLQLEKIKLATDSAQFYQSEHEFFYLMKTARIVLKRYKPQLKIIEAKNVRYLLFVRADKRKDCIDLDSKYEAYGLFAFNSHDVPTLLDMANIESEIGYFSPE